MVYIKAIKISKNYGAKQIVKGVDLTIQKCEILAIIGPNGAGKSTTIEMLVGLRKAEDGGVKYWDSMYKEHIGVQLQSVPFFPGLSSLENLQLFAAFYKKHLTVSDAKQLLDKCGLHNCYQTEASKLSGGQQKRLAIAAALVHEPTLVFLDEPTAALDPRSRREIHELIHQLYQEGKSVVFTSHDMDEVLKLATRVIMIDGGRVIAEGDPELLCTSYEVQDLESLYLTLTSKEEFQC